MDRHLILDSDEAFRLAEELAAVTGKDASSAVIDAMRDYLNREKDRRARLARVKQLARQIRASINGPISSADHDELYGEDGLPT